MILENKRINFDFVDTIRAIAMMGIVFEHAVYNGSNIFEGFSVNHLVYISLLQIGKFGTIAFFLLAGFLLGSKFTTYSSWEYFKRRLNVLFKPWLVWSFVFIITWLIQYKVRLKAKFIFSEQLAEKFEWTYLYTNYWFIINFLFCIGLLLIFKKHLYKKWLGAIFLAFSAIYITNVYFEWFKPTHTIAIFGFVFYLWLGAYVNKHWAAVEARIKITPYWLLTLLVISSFAWAVFDIVNLIKMNSVDPYNTLRISNVVYSLLVIALLFKIKNFRFIKFINPRETTFGVYLIHYIFVVVLLPEVYRSFKLVPLQQMPVLPLIAYSVSRFLVAYVATMLLINVLLKTKLKWIIGR